MKIVFKVALVVAAIDEVNARIDGLIFYLAVASDIRVPFRGIWTGYVVGPSWQLVAGARSCVGIGADQLHTHSRVHWSGFADLREQVFSERPRQTAPGRDSIATR